MFRCDAMQDSDTSPYNWKTASSRSTYVTRSAVVNATTRMGGLAVTSRAAQLRRAWMSFGVAAGAARLYQ